MFDDNNGELRSEDFAGALIAVFALIFGVILLQGGHAPSHQSKPTISSEIVNMQGGTPTTVEEIYSTPLP